MKITLLHPRHAAFPKFDFDWDGKRIYPVGILGAPGDTDIAVGIIQADRQRHAVAVHPDGTVSDLDARDAGEALYDALDRTGNHLWGHTWNSAVGEIFGINRRTTQRDRVSTNLLPPRLLMYIGYIVSAKDAFELAGLLLLLARYENAGGADREKTEGHIRSALDFYYGERSEATMGLRF